MRFQKLISPAAFFCTALVLLDFPASIGQVLEPIRSPRQERVNALSHREGDVNRPTHMAIQEETEPFKLSSRFHLEKGTNIGYLILKVELPEGSYIYSTTQKPPLRPSKIQVTKSNQFRMKASFTPDRPPLVIEKDPVFEQRLEKHVDVVQFFATVEISPGVTPESLEAELAFSGQVCNERGFCVPVLAAKTTGKFAGYYERAAAKRKIIQSELPIGDESR